MMKRLHAPSAVRSVCSLFAVVLVVGCGRGGETETIDIVFDPCEPLVLDVQSASAEDEAGVVDAIALWNERAGSLLTLDEVEDAPQLPIIFDDAPAAFNGHYDDEDAVVYINRELEGRETAITVAHELGHAFGLYHVRKEERPSVMNHGNLVHAPNDGDVDALEALWGACSGS